MRSFNDYILEKLHLSKDTKSRYKYHPKTNKEFYDLVAELLKERGKDANLNDIDTSEITSMHMAFNGLDPHNIDISKWDVSNVDSMYQMFCGCENFNCDLSNWNVSNVTNMKSMFYNCIKLNTNLDNWQVSKKCDTDFMFWQCRKQKIPTWYKR
jgi:surface protein